MIGEPELEGGPGPARPADVLDGGADRPALGAALRDATAHRRPWAWALTAVVATCAVWAGVLQGTGYGHTHVPDLHGYHLGGNPCTGVNLEPLTDALGAETLNQDTPVLHKGPALDHASCTLLGSRPTGDGWAVDYTVTVTVDLHKKTDPKAEFTDSSRIPPPPPNGSEAGTYIIFTDPADMVTRPFPGIGDQALLTTSHTRQSLQVLHGGAVFGITVDGSNVWTRLNNPPLNADGSPTRPSLVDTSSLRSSLAPAVRHLMSALSSPDGDA